MPESKLQWIDDRPSEQKSNKDHFDTILTRLAKVSTPENHLKFLEVDSYEVWPAKDWTPGFVEEFKTRYGYDPIPYLPLLRDIAVKIVLLENDSWVIIADW